MTGKADGPSRMSAGGAATQAGTRYESNIAVSCVVSMLSGARQQPPFGLPPGHRITSVHCQTVAPVDDVMLATSGGGFVFLQAKTKISLSAEFDKTIGQFVLQFLSMERGKGGTTTREWERSFNPSCDRIVLVTTSESSSTIRRHLPNLLSRFGDHPSAEGLLEVARNQAERSLAERLDKAFAEAWRGATGTTPEPDELKRLCRGIKVAELDLESGQRDRSDALGRLRADILSKPESSDSAWQALYELAEIAHTNRQAITPSAAMEALANIGIAIQAAPDFRADIEALRRATAQTLADTESLAALPGPKDSPIAIKRDGQDALQAAAQEGNLVVVGTPGSGKSGFLHMLAKDLDEAGEDVVFLAMDRFPFHLNSELTDRLKLSHDLVEVLENWPGTRTGYVVVDALDAARDPKVQGFWHEILKQIAKLGPRWTLVASIREFELRYSEDWKSLFHGKPVPGREHTEFSAIRHIEVRPLTDGELADIIREFLPLGPILESSARLKHLLRNIFNLRLAVELISRDDFDESHFSLVRHRSQLLDVYWRQRLHHPPIERENRERALKALTELMVKQRSLRASTVDNSLHGHGFADLERLNFVRPLPPTKSELQFAHHILFDYAAARLVLGLGQAPDEIVRSLHDEPDLALFLAQSLRLVFEHLWTAEASTESDSQARRNEFWGMALAFSGAEGLTDIARLHGPTVVAYEAKTLSDVVPLVTRARLISAGGDSALVVFLRHLVGAHLLRIDEGATLVGDDGEPWPAFAQQLSEIDHEDLVVPIRQLVWQTDRALNDATVQQRAAIGAAARNLLRATWRRAQAGAFYDDISAQIALEAVCRSFETDPVASAGLIREALAPAHLAEHGFREAPEIAEHVAVIAKNEPGLAVEVFEKIFSHQEPTQDTTVFGGGGGSQILPLTSNRRQDFDQGKWRLAEVYPKLARSDPLTAARIAIRVIDVFARQKDRGYAAGREARGFSVAGGNAEVVADNSCIWGDINRAHDEEIKILKQFAELLDGLAADTNGPVIFEAIREIAVDENRTAAIWARIIHAAAEHPKEMAAFAVDIVSAAPILTGLDTDYAAGCFLASAFPTLTRKDKEQIEAAILQLAKDDETVEYGQKLIGLLPREAIVAEQIRDLRDEIEAKGEIQENRPHFQFSVGFSKGRSASAYLRESGVEVDDARNAPLTKLLDRLDLARAELPTEITSTDDFENLRPMLQDALDTLVAARGSDADREVWERALDHLANIADRFASYRVCGREPAIRRLLKDVFALAATGKHPEADEEQNRQFATSQSWGSPNARIHAAEGLMDLRYWDPSDFAEFEDELGRLALDADAAVRSQVASRLIRRDTDNTDWARDMLAYVAFHEENAGVAAVAVGCIERLSRDDRDEAFRLAKGIVDRFRGVGDESDGFRCEELAFQLIADLHVWHGYTPAGTEIEALLEAVAANAGIIRDLLSRYRDTLIVGAADETETEREHMARQRALAFLRSAVEAALARSEPIIAALEKSTDPEEASKLSKEIKPDIGVLDQAVLQLYFASGGAAQKNEDRPTTAQQRRLFDESEDIFRRLSGHGIVHTAHHLIETLENFIEYQPENVFDLIGEAVRASARHGYAAESLALDVIVRIVERYIADHRELFRDAQRRQTLLDILDSFVRLGWPKARRLVYKVGEIW